MQPRRTGAMVAISAAVFAFLAATGAAADDTATGTAPQGQHAQPAADAGD